MKKIIALLLATLMVVSLTSCGGKNREVVESIDITTTLDKELSAVEEMIGMNLYADTETPLFQYYNTKDMEWSIVIDTKTNLTVYAAYSGNYTTINGLKTKTNYEEATNTLISNGYCVATDETKNELYFGTADDSFIGLCTFDSADSGCLLGIQVDTGAHNITFHPEWDTYDTNNTDVDSDSENTADQDIYTEITAAENIFENMELSKDAFYKKFEEKYKIISNTGMFYPILTISTESDTYIADFYLDFSGEKLIGCGFNGNDDASIMGLSYGTSYDDAKAAITDISSYIYEDSNTIFAKTKDTKAIIIATFEEDSPAFEKKALFSLDVFKNTSDLSLCMQNYSAPFAFFGKDLKLINEQTLTDLENTEITEYTYETTDKTVIATLGRSVSIVKECNYNILGVEYGMNIENAKSIIEKNGYTFNESLIATSELFIITLKTNNNCISAVTIERNLPY